MCYFYRNVTSTQFKSIRKKKYAGFHRKLEELTCVS